MVWERILRLCQGAVNLVTAVALLLCSGFGAYALWDNGQVLASAADVQAQLLLWKPEPAAPETEAPDNGEAFVRLRQINPDVRGWITMEGTGIDFPVLQGSNNLTYISRDVFGNFSLAGSIFLDSRDDGNFDQSYALLYGHHMADGKMFGDLDRYKEDAFFRENPAGQLILPGKVWQLETVACLVVGAAEKWIFDPDYVRQDMAGFLRFVRENALHLGQLPEEGGKYLVLSTCSGEFTDARTVVITRMYEVGQEA